MKRRVGSEKNLRALSLKYQNDAHATGKDNNHRQIKSSNYTFSSHSFNPHSSMDSLKYVKTNSSQKNAHPKNKVFTLFCVLDGEPLSAVIDVWAPSRTSVSQLKSLIRTTAKIKSRSIAWADDLDTIDDSKMDLWKVNMSCGEDDLPVRLTDIVSKSKLNPCDKLSNIFEKRPASGFIHNHSN
ncbi:hypothetical protein BCR41DRAFT_132367 [Lobosporangium transversale]|uniref:Crinkler effector protein N-terminal domain-containing protein n=1 Tax=Lobosporangium transversale TaxID=64571 RepID=A0A1Y2GG98_9FUNG|nr:hypothetical protein BCR41DRAFT_132367 [Lobosporangium transversale]ORZ10008.1 hypothetical protein BCR41DRAFT_132367 [Lobosporangium transversale]|eukprot:XP_021879098.1 hypothetical protein BCR41DRAFT_132367 [Lobosporangium transversale]